MVKILLGLQSAKFMERGVAKLEMRNSKNNRLRASASVSVSGFVSHQNALTSSRTLDNMTQGPHQVAKKSITMGLSLLEMATSSSCVVTFFT